MDTCTAFVGTRRIASGTRDEVAVAALPYAAGDPVLVFDDATGAQFDLDLRGTAEDVRQRYAAPAPGPGRPKLGVVPREVTLLPRHWDWLNAQPGGASVALRRLVDEARKATIERDATRQAKDAAARFMTALGGNLENYEDASRALYAGDLPVFTRLTENWPSDVRDYARQLADGAFASTAVEP